MGNDLRKKMVTKNKDDFILYEQAVIIQELNQECFYFNFVLIWKYFSNLTTYYQRMNYKVSFVYAVEITRFNWISAREN